MDTRTRLIGVRRIAEATVVLVIDNYDSFVYNLVQAIVPLGYRCEVVRNDRIDLAGIERLAPSHIVLSPGPCTPGEAGICCAVIERFAGRIPLLGVCLGHQCIGQVFGARIVRAPEPVHGKRAAIIHDGRGVFLGLPNPLSAARYHSLVVQEPVPDELEVSARTACGLVMGLRHRTHAVEGVQFHPESYMTEHGRRLLANFLGAAAAAEDTGAQNARSCG